jgi:hypothetical protein
MSVLSFPVIINALKCMPPDDDHIWFEL